MPPSTRSEPSRLKVEVVGTMGEGSLACPLVL